MHCETQIQYGVFLSGIVLLGATAWYLLDSKRSRHWAVAVSWVVVGGLNIYRSFTPQCIKAMEKEREIGRSLFGAFVPFVAWGPPVGFAVLLVLIFAAPGIWVRILSGVGVAVRAVAAFWYTLTVDQYRKW